MNSYIDFLIEANLCFIVFYGFYYLFLRNETDFQFKRIYLVGSTLLTLVIPLLHFGTFFKTPVYLELIDLDALVPQGWIDASTSGNEVVENNTALSGTNSGVPLLAMIYWAGVLISATLIVYHLVIIFRFYRLRHELAVKEEGYTLIPTDGQFPTFSFFKWLFYDNTVDLDKNEKNKVIFHEKVHIRQFHSIDVLLLEFVRMIFWFNPLTWFYKRHLTDTHEFIADQQSIKTMSSADYTSLLAKMTLQKMGFSLGHHFNRSITLKRIEMMKLKTSKMKPWKVASLIPVVLAVSIIFSCNDDVVEDVNEVMETGTQLQVPPHLETKLAELQKKYPDADFAYMEFEGDSEEALKRLKEKTNHLDPSSIALVEVSRDKNISVFFNKNGALKAVTEQYQSDGEIFTIAEQPATPAEGDYDTYYYHIARNLKYPKQARENGIEGRVYVQFIVNKDGSISDVLAVKGIGGGCDDEAVRVVSASPDWVPARQRGKLVRQKIVLPITFKLDNGEKSVSERVSPVSEDKNDNELSEMVVVGYSAKAEGDNK